MTTTFVVPALLNPILAKLRNAKRHYASNEEEGSFHQGSVLHLTSPAKSGFIPYFCPSPLVDEVGSSFAAPLESMAKKKVVSLVLKQRLQRAFVQLCFSKIWNARC